MVHLSPHHKQWTGLLALVAHPMQSDSVIAIIVRTWWSRYNVLTPFQYGVSLPVHSVANKTQRTL